MRFGVLNLCRAAMPVAYFSVFSFVVLFHFLATGVEMDKNLPRVFRLYSKSLLAVVAPFSRPPPPLAC